MAVDVDFDDSGAVVAVCAVDPAVVAREQAAKLAGQAGVAARQAGEVARQAAAEFKARGLPVLMAYAEIVGVKTLIAMALVFIGWFFFSAVSLEFLGVGISASFYDLMRVLNNPQSGLMTIAGQGQSGAGFYGLFTILALLAPCVPHVFKNRTAWLAYGAPAAWMLLAVLIGYIKINSSLSAAQSQVNGLGSMFGLGSAGTELGGIAREFMNEAAGALSIGFGAYLSLVAAGYLVFLGVRRYRSHGAAS